METQVKKAIRLINKVLKAKNLNKKDRENFTQLKAELEPLKAQFNRDKYHTVLRKIIAWGIVSERIIKELISLWTSDKQ